MARVIVILALMLAITAAMFALTRKSAVAPGEAATDARTTVQLGTPSDDPIDDAASLTSAAARPSTTATASAPPSAPASAQEVASGPITGAAPAFGTAGVDHKGNASFTGTATPGDSVSLLLNGKPLGKAKADGEGNWSIAFKAPSSESHLLVSAQTKDGSIVIGPQRAVIRPPSTSGGLPRVTLKAADQTATTLQEGNVAAPEAKTGLVVEKVTGGEDGRASLTGRADASATVKASINGKPAGEARVARDGAWALAVSNLSHKASTSLRLELIDKDGATLDQTDVPYKIEGAPKLAVADSRVSPPEASSVLTSKPRAKPKRKGAAHTAKNEQDLAALFEPKSASDDQTPKIIKVRRGDSLWRISRRHLGNGKKWAAFYKANKDKIDNPDLIYPGQVLILPG